jgi:hypothetical protein
VSHGTRRGADAYLALAPRKPRNTQSKATPIAKAAMGGNTTHPNASK